jgi:hypothetical protein
VQLTVCTCPWDQLQSAPLQSAPVTTEKVLYLTPLEPQVAVHAEKGPKAPWQLTGQQCVLHETVITALLSAAHDAPPFSAAAVT